jgi:hypothetical protein
MNVSLYSVNNNSIANYLRQQRQALIDKNYNEIYAHELAHKRAGGSFAGDIVIERNAEGIPVGGHVPIKMPTLDKNNPQRTIEHANIVINSAMAPADPSEQDYNVANQARAIKQQAIEIKNNNPNLGKKLDIQG